MRARKPARGLVRGEGVGCLGAEAVVHEAEGAAAGAVDGEAVDGAEGVVPRVALRVPARASGAQ